MELLIKKSQEVRVTKCYSGDSSHVGGVRLITSEHKHGNGLRATACACASIALDTSRPSLPSPSVVDASEMFRGDTVRLELVAAYCVNLESTRLRYSTILHYL